MSICTEIKACFRLICYFFEVVCLFALYSQKAYCFFLSFHDFPGLEIEIINLWLSKFFIPVQTLYTEILPLFQNETSGKTFHMKMSLICIKINLLAELNFIWMVFDTETKDSSEMAYYNNYLSYQWFTQM